MALAFVVINLTHTFVLYRSGCRDIKICFPLHVINVVNTSKVHCCPPGEICAPVTRTMKVVDTETSLGVQIKIKPRRLVNIRRNGARLEVQTVNVVETELHQHCAVLINKHKTRRLVGLISRCAAQTVETLVHLLAYRRQNTTSCWLAHSQPIPRVVETD